MYTLAQLHKLHTKEFLIFWIANDPPLKVNLFISFQTVQNMHNGMKFQIFFLFFPTKEPLQLSITSLIDSGNTHWTPKMARTISQRVLTTIQCKRMWNVKCGSYTLKFLWNWDWALGVYVCLGSSGRDIRFFNHLGLIGDWMGLLWWGG